MTEEDKPFMIPEKMIDKIFEISGGANNKNKGLILAVCNDKGDPVIYSRFDESIVQIGLTSSLMDYLNVLKKGGVDTYDL